jgi:hypothetical protein
MRCEMDGYVPEIQLDVLAVSRGVRYVDGRLSCVTSPGWAKRLSAIIPLGSMPR